MDIGPDPFAWQRMTRASEFKSFIGDRPSDPLLTHQSTRASAIKSIVGDGQSSHRNTFLLIFEHQFKTRLDNGQNRLVSIKKPFLVANKETFLGLCADIMCIFALDYLPILRVKWLSLNGREEETRIDDQNIIHLLQLLRTRGSIDKIRIYRWVWLLSKRHMDIRGYELGRYEWAINFSTRMSIISTSTNSIEGLRRSSNLWEKYGIGLASDMVQCWLSKNACDSWRKTGRVTRA